MSGKAGRFNVGLLNMQTDEVPGVAPSNNFGVVRLSRDLPNRSSLGVLLVNRQGMGALSTDRDYNRTFSIDGRLGVRQNTVVTGFLAKTQLPRAPHTDAGRGEAGRRVQRAISYDPAALGRERGISGNWRPVQSRGRFPHPARLSKGGCVRPDTVQAGPIPRHSGNPAAHRCPATIGDWTACLKPGSRTWTRTGSGRMVTRYTRA